MQGIDTGRVPAHRAVALAGLKPVQLLPSIRTKGQQLVWAQLLEPVQLLQESRQRKLMNERGGVRPDQTRLVRKR